MKKILLICLFLISPIILCAEQFEYTIIGKVNKAAAPKNLEIYCNEMANDGWRLIFVDVRTSMLITLYFERVKKTKSAE